MNWHYALDQQKSGPISEDNLVERLNSGDIARSALVWNPKMSEWVGVMDSSLALRLSPLDPPPIPSNFGKSPPRTTTKFVSEVGVLTDKVLRDLRELKPQFLMPWDEIKSFRWIKDRNLMLVAGIGLFPLLCMTLFDDLKSAYWALALYFSTLWALFFYRQFPSSQVTQKRALACFFGTGLVSITVLLLLQKIPPLVWLREIAGSNNLLPHFFGMFAGVTIWEELCKLLMVVVMVRTTSERLTLQTLLFYGLISGLGFGIYEGVSYQMGLNLLVDNVGAYYLLNVIRLTTLPFLHAIWTGIAGYFIGLSMLYPDRKHGLIVAALLIPAVLHALHNTFGGLLEFGIDFLSVLALLVYLRQSSAFEQLTSVPQVIRTEDKEEEAPAVTGK
jgi:RsiW-degrading membrane proteinase PrsW (M82 family)